MVYAINDGKLGGSKRVTILDSVTIPPYCVFTLENVDIKGDLIIEAHAKVYFNGHVRVSGKGKIDRLADIEISSSAWLQENYPVLHSSIDNFEEFYNNTYDTL